MCAFNRDDHRVDGKLHCWLCKLSYKRALAKAKKSDIDKQRQKKRSADEASMKMNSSHKIGNSSSHRSGNHSSQRSEPLKVNLSEIPEKIPKTANTGNNSDLIKDEQIASLQKKLQQKDAALLQKDKEITEWKSKHFTIELEMRNKMKDQEKIYETKLDVLNRKVQMQLKEIAQLSKLQKRNERIANKESTKVEKDNSSGTDSPNTN